MKLAQNYLTLGHFGLVSRNFSPESLDRCGRTCRPADNHIWRPAPVWRPNAAPAGGILAAASHKWQFCAEFQLQFVLVCVSCRRATGPSLGAGAFGCARARDQSKVSRGRPTFGPRPGGATGARRRPTGRHSCLVVLARSARLRRLEARSRQARVAAVAGHCWRCAQFDYTRARLYDEVARGQRQIDVIE